MGLSREEQELVKQALAKLPTWNPTWPPVVMGRWEDALTKIQALVEALKKEPNSEPVRVRVINHENQIPEER